MELGGTKSPFDCLLLDLDDTLYSSTIGIGQACKRNIDEFLASKCCIPAESASSLRVELFKSHGSSLAGLVALGYDVHPDEYHSYVHGRLPYELINPDAPLRELLLGIPQPKILFTNSDRQHATRTLQRLGVEECFQRIVSFETMNPHLFKDGRGANCPPPQPPSPSQAVEASQVILKPSPAAMELAVRLAGFAPNRMFFVDDNERNIAAGKAAGLRTALVGKLVKTKEADYLLDRITGLKQVIPEICGLQEKGGEENDDGEQGMTSTMRRELDSMRTTTKIGA